MNAKLVVAWCVVALAFVLPMSCSIKHASGQYECDTTADCDGLDGNRVCSDGFCVIPGGKDAAIDSPKPKDAAIDAATCPAQCSSCNTEKKECTVDCSQNANLCAGQMTCPMGWSCIIKCNSSSSCRNGINCLMATACNIECSGSFSCRNITCGPGICNTTCSGNNSCSGISCGSSCRCDVKCGTNASCFNVICTHPFCTFGAGCSSQNTGCNTCP